MPVLSSFLRSMCSFVVKIKFAQSQHSTAGAIAVLCCVLRRGPGVAAASSNAADQS